MRVTSIRIASLPVALLSCSLVIGGGAVRPVTAGEPVILQPGADGVQRATLTLDSYSYSPDHLIVQAGKPVELTLTSVTTITPHNFIIKELAVEQDVGAGKTVTVRFTPMQSGTFPFYCDKKLLFLPSHREKGMEGRLEVR
ncbi:MAG: cupredoxin domain-containing protein [Nitrospirota bacterium]|nr:cupredoxin domain-containing protein [Nitrospirota bacterium]MDE3035819.1 cupredoxin domain-containing protein [Nitrospirota bacterium]MDE3243410.1 cupredoxin domain-containing protein [Nitrospirota bacterium]